MKVKPVKKYRTGNKEFSPESEPYEVDDSYGKMLIDSGLAVELEPPKNKVHEPDSKKTK